MSMDERSLETPIPDQGRIFRALAELRWCGGKLQQAWAPFYGGQVEWRDVPVVPDTAGVMASAPAKSCMNCANDRPGDGCAASHCDSRMSGWIPTDGVSGTEKLAAYDEMLAALEHVASGKSGYLNKVKSAIASAKRADGVKGLDRG